MDNHKRRDLIIFNMSDYGDWQDRGIVNRNYFILRELLKSQAIGKVLAVDLLPHNYKRALKKFITLNCDRSARRAINRGFLSRLYQADEKLYVYSAVCSMCASGEKRIYAKINKVAEGLNFENIILWSYLPTFTKYFDEVDAELKIFDAVDDWSEHSGYQKIKQQIINNYEIIDKKADIIFTVSSALKKLFKNNQNVHWIPNGVDARHFAFRKEGIALEDIKNIGRPIIGYVGIVQDRFDVDLLESLLKKNPDKSFVIIGMIWPNSRIEKLKKYSNLFLLGQKKYQDIPAYLKEFSAAIIPHKINKFTRSMNPLKLYEYLAAGKPIISTGVAGLEKFTDLVSVADDYEEFNKKLNDAIAVETLDKVGMRKKIAQENSWSVRANAMLRIINQLN